MSIKNKMKTAAVSLATVAGIGVGASNAEAQVKMATADVVVHYLAKDSVYVRGQLAADLPGKLDYFGFLEIYPDGTFFGKSTLAKDLPAWIVGKDLAGKLTAETEVVHSGTPASRVALGAGIKIPVPRGYGKIKLLDYIPAWANGEKGASINEIMLGASGETKIANVNLRAFAYYSLTQKRMDYGEAEVTVDAGKHVEFGFNPCFSYSGFTPRMLVRLKK